MRRAWTEESFSYEGKFHSYKDVAIWPRPVQQPYPPVWVPITGSRESIEWAAKYDIPITPGTGSFGGPGGIPLIEDIVAITPNARRRHGRKVTPDHLNVFIDCYVADSKEQAIEEYGPYSLYYFNTLFAFDHVTQDKIAGRGYYSATSGDFKKSNAVAAISNDAIFGGMTMDMVRAQAENGAWGAPDECVKRIIDEAEIAGAGTVILTCNQRGDAAGDVSQPDQTDRRGSAAAAQGTQDHAREIRGRHSMKVFIFDLLPYRENLDYLKVDGELPRPLGKQLLRAGRSKSRTYAEHLDAWEEMERVGFDGMVMNEHHGTPYGTMNSPNLLAASIIQRTKRMKICIYGNLLPIHEPLGSPKRSRCSIACRMGD